MAAPHHLKLAFQMSSFWFLKDSMALCSLKNVLIFTTFTTFQHILTNFKRDFVNLHVKVTMMTSLKENKEEKKDPEASQEGISCTALCCHLLDNIISQILGNMSDHQSVESDKVK